MEVKNLVAKGIFFSFVVVLVISGNHAQEVAPRPCSGAFEFVGKFVCARNAECSMPDNAVSCHCPAGYLGDAFKLGSGCVPTEADVREKRDADADADVDAERIPGLWTGQKWRSPLRQCYGQYIWVGLLLCEPGVTCMVREDPFEFKCQCPPGKSGDGFDRSWGGQGCS